MATVDPNTPEIPGFQPLHIRGPGRMGIWIEARQVRLDRRVLLKVLPASDRSQQDQFIEEIRAIVRLDGDGALRVIDEGAVGQARYVALDEAEGRSLSSISREEIEPDRLAVMLVHLHQHLHLQGWSIESIPLSSMLKLPAGRYAVTELGPLTEQADERPCQLQAAKNLTSVANSLSLSSRWQEPIRALRSGEGGFSRCLELLQQNAPAAPKKVPMLVALMALIAIVGGVVNWRMTGAPEPLPLDPSGGASLVTGSDPSQQNPGEPKPSGVADQRSVLQVPDTQVIEQRTQALAEERWQRREQLENRDLQWGDWNRSRDEILRSFSEGNYSRGRTVLESISIALETDLASERDALKSAYAWIEARQLQTARKAAQQQIQLDQFPQAAAIIEQMAITLGLEPRFSAEVDRLQRTGRLYQQLLTATELKMEQLLLGISDDFEVSLEAPSGVDRYPSLAQRWRQFKTRLESLRLDARTICETAGKLVGEDRGSSWCLLGDSPFDARVIAVSRQEVTLKRIGRRQPETHPWSSISAQTWLLLIGDSAAEPQALERLQQLSVIWSVEGTILTLARSSMGGEIPAAADRIRIRQLDTWLEEGRRAQQLGELELLRQIALSMYSWSDQEQRQENQELLMGWWSELADRDGPKAFGLFPDATLSGWSAENRTIRIRWQGGVGGLADWQPSPGSIISARGDLTRLRGRVTLESTLRFESSVEMTIIGVATREDAPNLNVVLWDGTPRALIFGVGIRPPEVSSIRVGEDDVLLPAHAIIEEQILAQGGGELLMPTPLPRVPVGQPIRIEFRENGDGAQLELNGSPVLSADPRPGPRIGGIAFETYGVDVLVKELDVVGQISEEDWRLRLQEEARKVLSGTP
ncbi:MAG: hypothetical protein OSB09_05235 [Planctomycetota bacterium]|nr:hypothetical protein [Planctomycetota bacterium]